MFYSRNSNIMSLLINKPFNIKNFVSTWFLNRFDLPYFICNFHNIHIMVIRDIDTSYVLIVWTKTNWSYTSCAFLNLKSRFKTTINSTPNKNPRLSTYLSRSCKRSIITQFKTCYIIIMKQRIDSCFSSWFFNHFSSTKELLLHWSWGPIKDDSSCSCHIHKFSARIKSKMLSIVSSLNPEGKIKFIHNVWFLLYYRRMIQRLSNLSFPSHYWQAFISVSNIINLKYVLIFFINLNIWLYFASIFSSSPHFSHQVRH